MADIGVDLVRAHGAGDHAGDRRMGGGELERSRCDRHVVALAHGLQPALTLDEERLAFFRRP
jgi:hypothetical protein